jgi:hypothetical protein
LDHQVIANPRPADCHVLHSARESNAPRWTNSAQIGLGFRDATSPRPLGARRQNQREEDVRRWRWKRYRDDRRRWGLHADSTEKESNEHDAASKHAHRRKHRSIAAADSAHSSAPARHLVAGTFGTKNQGPLCPMTRLSLPESNSARRDAQGQFRKAHSPPWRQGSALTSPRWQDPSLFPGDFRDSRLRSLELRTFPSPSLPKAVLYSHDTGAWAGCLPLGA